MHTPYLKKFYKEQVVAELMKRRGYKNVHQVPTVAKIVLNTGVGGEEKAVVEDAAKQLSNVAGQKAMVTYARKAISNFKLREGMPIGAKVTLRGNAMWDFLYRLINISLPVIRDFRGVPQKLDGQGNYTLGIADITIFPEIHADQQKKSIGLDITIVTTAPTDDEGRELLKLLGMPFRKSTARAKKKGAEEPAEAEAEAEAATA